MGKKVSLPLFLEFKERKGVDRGKTDENLPRDHRVCGPRCGKAR